MSKNKNKKFYINVSVPKNILLKDWEREREREEFNFSSQSAHRALCQCKSDIVNRVVKCI